MKKVIMLLLSLLLFITGCTNNDNLLQESTGNIIDHQKPLFSLNTLSVFQNNNIYYVVIEENATTKKTVEFSSNRNSYNIKGLVLINNEDIHQYLDMSIDTVIKNLGEIHTDIGSGCYIPSYITKDGYLISFRLNNNVIIKVDKRDLFSNIVVECVGMR